MAVCDRCGKTTHVTTTSFFNTDTICVLGDDSCKAKETRHPQYKEARRVEEEAVRRGEYNFAGIGKPADL